MLSRRGYGFFARPIGPISKSVAETIPTKKTSRGRSYLHIPRTAHRPAQPVGRVPLAYYSAVMCGVSSRSRLSCLPTATEATEMDGKQRSQDEKWAGGDHIPHAGRHGDSALIVRVTMPTSFATRVRVRPSPMTRDFCPCSAGHLSVILRTPRSPATTRTTPPALCRQPPRTTSDNHEKLTTRATFPCGHVFCWGAR